MQKLINQFSYQPQEFCFNRSSTFDMIKKTNETRDDYSDFTTNSQDSYWYKSRYMLYVTNSLNSNGYKFVSCTCVDYNNNFISKHTLAIKMDFKLKFIYVI